MSAVNNNLTLYLKLDAVREPTEEGQLATVPDVSDNHHQVDVNGSPKLVVDKGFGSCLQFNDSRVDDYLKWTDVDDKLSRGMTLSVWIYHEPVKTIDAMVFIRLGADVWMDFQVDANGIVALQDSNEHVVKASEYPILPNQWTHVAVVIQSNGEAQLWLAGRPAGTGSMTSLAATKFKSICVGAYQGAGDVSFHGKIAHMRLHSALLSQEEIQRQYSMDQSSVLDIRESSPLEFELWDEQQQSAIYVAGGEISHKLTVAIWNRDTKQRIVQFKALETKQLIDFKRADETLKKQISDFKSIVDASKKISSISDDKYKLLVEQKDALQADFFIRNHHLELRLPRGTFSVKSSKWFQNDLDRQLAKKTSELAAEKHESPAEDSWYIYYQNHPTLNSESLYLLRADDKAQALEFSDEKSAEPALEIILPHITTNQESAGQVLPIELRPGPLARREGPANLILGKRIKTVEVLSQLGQKHIPLHFDVVGSNTVLNDGASETALLLRITNVDREVSIPIHGKGNRQTQFVLACEITDQGGHHEWALTDEKNKVTVQVQEVNSVGAVQPKPDEEIHWESDPIQSLTNGQMVEWVIDGELLGTHALKPNESIYLRLKVKTGLRSGPSDVHLYYRHILGYWDGSRACTIQKSPLIFHHMSASMPAHSSIYTANNYSPKNDDSKIPVLIEYSMSKGGTRQLKDFARKFSEQVKIVSVYTDKDSLSSFADRSDVSYPDDQDYSDASFFSLYAFGKSLFEDYVLWFSDDRLMEYENKVEDLCGLSVPLWPPTPPPSEHIGIGTNKPASKLSVTDGLTIGGEWAHKNQAPKGGLLVEGNVGIGTMDPGENKLRVTGGPVQVDDALTVSGASTFENNVTVQKILITVRGDIAAGDGEGGYGNFRQNASIGCRDAYKIFRNQKQVAVMGMDSSGEKLQLFTGDDASETTARLTVDKEGNVGIGHSNPSVKLDIVGSIQVKDPGAKTATIQVGTDQGKEPKLIKFGDGDYVHVGENGKDDNLELKGTTIQMIGNVGICIIPTKAKLEIHGAGSEQNLSSIYLQRDVDHYWSPGGNADAKIPLEDFRGTKSKSHSLSIYATNDVAALGFVSHSDARIKTLEGCSDGVADLAILSRIEITDYLYKDGIKKDSGLHKKVIAQQVESVYPQAVNKITDVVPDIYKKAAVKDGWVDLTTDLKVGERVRLIGEEDEAIYDVLEVRTDAFRTAFKPTTDELFVYGREVDDFGLVDYEAIAMLNVSATQQIKKEKDMEVKALQDENAALKTRFDALEAMVKTLTGIDPKTLIERNT